ncbi:PREDICTED: uncharacterized protein LOC108772033 [Cyphomyrmex costatus]|uniref:uncharacterized protein LOC108772033 n=1 Tax=Cyphomyrmex costatus TaxID=456900 RepID=UPI0008522E37|nr:PREDICTED: uncharacterized protein LOC108772033 [Cyphomyrmex costatus]
MQDDEHIKVLGIIWNLKLDIFQFRVTLPSSSACTKRVILSTTAKFFDPLGWATPVTVTAKIFLQRLWALHCHWDDEIPRQLLDCWMDYYKRLPYLNALSIPRWTTSSSQTVHRALHGFSDASTAAYAAVVYLRTVSHDGSVTVTLLTAKSKVAPLKTISVPRLELSAAMLLARLIQFTRSALQLPNIECHCWTDSTITLAWLAQSPSRWRTFVANRVSTVQSLIPEVPWRHIMTQTNPADCASRGLAPDLLEKHDLWWSGPPWLRQPPESWPHLCPSVPSNAPLEHRSDPPVCALHATSTWDLESRYSSWPKLLRITAYLYHFLNRLRACKDSQFCAVTLIPKKIQQAKSYWLGRMQSHMFPSEIAALNQQRPLPKNSPLSTLNPYLDKEGLIRLRGRLRRANLPGATKNPLVLRSHPLVVLIIQHHHLRMLHSGVQLTLASLRSEFWILRARATVRGVLYKCIQCTRERADIPTGGQLCIFVDFPHFSYFHVT